MPDRSAIEKLIESAPLAVILIGVVVFILAAAGGLPVGNPPIQIIDPTWKYGLGILGVILILVGLVLLIRERLTSTNGKVNSRTSTGAGTVLLQEYPSQFQTDLENAKEIWLVGVSLGSMINEQYSLLESKIKQGIPLRILVRDPNGETFRFVSRHSYTPITPEQVKTKILLTLSRLCELKRIAPSDIEIRVLDHYFLLGMCVLDPSMPSGKIYIEYYPFKMAKAGQPKLVISRLDTYWFDFYKSQLETLWKTSNTWKCSKEKPGRQKAG